MTKASQRSSEGGLNGKHYPVSNSSEGRAAVDGVQLTIMCARALATLVAFSAACSGLLVLAALWLRQQLQQSSGLAAWWPALLALPLAAELLFAWAWLGKYRRLNAQPAPHAPKHPSFDPRQAFNKFAAEQHRTSQWISIEKMLRSWFGSVPLENILAGNVAELITYGFWYMSREEYEATYQRPALELTHELERAWGLRFKPGYNPDLAFMAHLWQPVRCHYRPLAFYLGVEVVFLLKHLLMLSMGFTSGSVHGFTYYVYQPADPMAQQRVPVLFQHGVGLGLMPYAHFVARLACMGRPVAALECAHLGMRWVPHVPCAEEVAEALAALMRQRLGWGRACVAGHSYGTFYASRLMQLHPELVDSLCLMDPVTVAMFTGKLISNFVYTPGGATGNLVTWFVARDIHHAASVSRNFFWSQLNLWPDQLPARSLMVLSDADELVPVKEVLAMLAHEAPHTRLLHHPNHHHADFLGDFAWQRQITRELAAMLDADGASANASPSPSARPAAAAALPALPWARLDAGSPQPGPAADKDAMAAAVGGMARRRRRSSAGAFSTPALAAYAAAPLGGPHEAAAAAAEEEKEEGRRLGGPAVAVAQRRSGLNRASGPSAGAAVPATPGKGTSGAVGHDRSDSASSYEAVASRSLRPLPHRLAKANTPPPSPARLLPVQ